MLIINATLANWTPPQVEHDQAVLIVGRKIAEIGPTAAMLKLYPDEEQIDARGQLLMPGNICAHTHFYGAFARGLAIPGPAPRNFPEILEKLWWPLDKSLTLEDVRLSALVCLVDAIKHGTTTLIDHHASPNAIEGSLDVIARAVEDSGLRAVLCYEVTDRDGKAKAEAGIAENVRFLDSLRSTPRLSLAGTFGLHAGLTLSDETLAACVEANRKFGGGFHIHVAEHEADEEDSITKYAMRVVQRLDRAGILNNLTIVAHAVHADPWELGALRRTGAWVSHQPRSNMNNAVGAMAFDDMLHGGIKLVMGNDGFTNNMWAEWKDAYLLHKVAHRDPRRANGADVVTVACDNNARLAEQFFPTESLGKVTAGAAADLILVDYHPFTPLTAGNLPWHVLFGFESSMVTTTIGAGKVLMKERQLLTLDEGKIAAEALARVPDVWARYNKFANASVANAS